MPSRIFGIDLRLPSPPTTTTTAATTTTAHTTIGTTATSLSDRPHPPKYSVRSPRLSPWLAPSATTNSEARRPSMDHIRRPSLAHLAKKHGSGEKKNSSKERSGSKDKHGRDGRAPTPAQPKAIKLGMVMESPPILFIGTPTQSTGALLSGRLQVTPNVLETTVDSITMYLECTTTTKRPVEGRCRECSSTVDDLYEWNFLTKPKTFAITAGMQDLPFSHLIPGHLPATTHGAISTIDYSLHVRARSSTTDEEYEFRRELIIHRALVPGNDKHSIRIFPPTNLTLRVTLPSIVHPIGEFPVHCRLSGITTKRDDQQTRWRLRKLSWHIEEHESTVSPACSKHTAKLGGVGKGIQHESTRTIGSQELKSGWKTDFGDGEIEGEFPASIDQNTHPQCGMDAPNGMKILHNLVIELVIAEEWAMNKRPQNATPTGAARVLRTQFALHVTDRAGMGISWDDEMPPMYEDVPASPPHYQNDHTSMMEYNGDDLHDDVEQLNLNA